MMAIILTLSVIAIISCSKTKSYDIQADAKGYVPNKETAIRVAKTICIPIIGENSCSKKEYQAMLIDGKIWKVTGDSRTEKGGIIIVEIQKSDCKIVNVKIIK